MSDRVPPARAARAEVCIVVQNVLVDVGEDQLPIGRAEDGHGDKAYVAVLRLGLLGLQGALLQERHGEREARAVRRVARCHGRRVQPQPLGHGVVVELQAVVVQRGGGDGRRVLAERPGASLGAAAHVVGLAARRGLPPAAAARPTGTRAEARCRRPISARSALVYVFLFSDAPLRWLRDSTRPTLSPKYG